MLYAIALVAVIVAFILLVISKVVRDEFPALSGFILLFFVGICSTLLYGITILKVWEWFIVPPFHLEPLTIVQAIGLQLVVMVLRPVFPDYAYDLEKMRGNERLSKTESRMMTNIVYPSIILITGWIVHLFL